MRELSFVIGLAAGLVLLVAFVAWLRIQRHPKNDLTKGGGGEPASNRAKTASWLLAVALGIAAVAAAFAVVAWFLRVLKIS